MRARKLVVAVLAVGVAGFIAYLCLSPEGKVDGTSAAGSTPTISLTPDMSTTTAGTPLKDLEPTTPSSAAQAAEDAARQGLTVAFTWHPATDSTQNDAYGRAREWLTDSLAERMAIDARTERGPGVQWTQWAKQQTKVIADVSIECSGCPEDTDTVIRRVATIKQTAVSGNGTETVEPDTTVWLTIIRDSGRWLIDEIRY